MKPSPTEAAAKRAETVRRKLTDIQEVVLRKVVAYCEKYQDAMDTGTLHAWLYDSKHNEVWSSGRRWSSRGEAAQPYIAALVKKGYLSRPSRGYLLPTDEGRERVS